MLVVIAFLGIFCKAMDHKEYRPDYQAEYPGIAPEAPGEEVLIQSHTRTDQGKTNDADDRQPGEIAIQHILQRRTPFGKTLPALYRVIEGDDQAQSAENDPEGIKMENFRCRSTGVASSGRTRVLEEPVNQVKMHSVPAPSMIAYSRWQQ